MEASKFIKESARMCDQYNYCCDGCPADGLPCITDWTNLAGDDVALEKYLTIVEKWSNEHPVKTNIMKFEEIFGKETASLVTSYAAGHVDEKLFRYSLTCWLGEEYKNVDKK